MELDAAERRRKRTIAISFALLLGVLLFFTFFSNTLLSFTLPKVRTETAIAGSLSYTLEGSGILQPVATASLANPAGWKVLDVLVKAGDRVKKGQTLVTYDSAEAEQQLEDEAANRSKMKLTLQSAQDQYIQTARGGDPLQIRGAKRDIDALKLDLETQERRMDGLRRQLTGNRAITAPFDGIVAELNAVEGMASGGEPDALIASSSEGYRLDIAVDAELPAALGITAGMRLAVLISAPGQAERSVDGMVAEVTEAPPRAGSSSGEEPAAAAAVPQLLLRIAVKDPELKGGEQARSRLEGSSGKEGLIVSGEAVRRDRDGMFVYRIEERRGPLGNEFIARKALIRASESNGAETMILSDGIYENDPIIVESGEPLQDGDRVRLH